MMKKNWLLIITSGVIYIAIIAITICYIINPGINKLKEANNIKELTYEEKTQLIDDINQKYIILEQEAANKYSPNIEKINQKYDDLITDTKEKYNKLETEIKGKYDAEEKKINKSISDNDYLLIKEFHANGFSKKYYTLSDKDKELREQKSELQLKEWEEIRNNESLENKELQTIEANRKNELNTIENNKKAELTRLNENKANEIESINKQNINKTSVRNAGVFNLIIGIVIVLIPLLYIILIFNKLTHLSNTVKEKWSQVDVLLKQRADLIPNIVEAIKGFTDHEKNTLTKVTKARNQVIKATTKEEEITANKNLSHVINKLFFLQENYPELKANTNFMHLQYNLKEIENNISISRQQYNKSVLKYKNKLEMFPSNIIASIFNFQPELFFEVENDDKENPTINFE